MDDVIIVMECLADSILNSGMSYGILSDMSKIPRTTLNDIASGTSGDIKLTTMNKLAKGLNLDLADLFIYLGACLHESRIP